MPSIKNPVVCWRSWWFGWKPWVVAIKVTVQTPWLWYTNVNQDTIDFIRKVSIMFVCGVSVWGVYNSRTGHKCVTMKLKAAEISAEGVRLQAMYIGHTILFMENITFMKDSVFKILRFQLRFQQQVYKTTCKLLGAHPRETSLWINCLSQGCQSVECLAQGCISAECLSQAVLWNQILTRKAGVSLESLSSFVRLCPRGNQAHWEGGSRGYFPGAPKLVSRKGAPRGF